MAYKGVPYSPKNKYPIFLKNGAVGRIGVFTAPSADFNLATPRIIPLLWHLVYPDHDSF